MKQVIGKKLESLRQRYKTDEAYRAFAAGFVAGQAEKIVLGVCKGAMFRPGKDNFDWYYLEVKEIAEHFGLEVSVRDSCSEETPYEIWIYKKEHEEFLETCFSLDVNSEEWHSYRGTMCGIPIGDIDFKYHLRDGYNKKCD